jgi:hypothetical protein
MEPNNDKINFDWEEFQQFFDQARNFHHKRNVLQIVKPGEKIPYTPGLVSIIISGDGTIYFANDQQHDEDLELIKKEALRKYLESKSISPTDLTKINFPKDFFNPSTRARLTIDKLYDGGIRGSIARSEITLQASTEPTRQQIRTLVNIVDLYNIQYGTFMMYWPNGERTTLSLKSTPEMGYTTFDKIDTALLQRKARIMQKEAALALNILDELKLYKLADKIQNKLLGI